LPGAGAPTVGDTRRHKSIAVAALCAPRKIEANGSGRQKTERERMTALRRFTSLALIIGALVLAAPPALRAAQQPISVAVFDFELVDTSLEGASRGTDPAETARLKLISNELRAMLAKSGKYRVVDLKPAAKQIADVGYFHGCNGCDADIAKSLGAERSITGRVNKISTLILNINIYVRDTASGQVIQTMSADIRSNSDDSWTHGVSWLVRNRLLAAAQ
jgi:Protein of unknown function (DUF2380)